MTKIKFCGFTNLEDLQTVIGLKVDYAGFIMVENSQRYISFKDSVELIDKIEKGETKTVAVVQNPSENLVQKIIKSGKFNVIQFHGDETVEDCEKYKTLITRHSHIDENPTTTQPCHSHGNENPSTTHTCHSRVGGNPSEIWKAFPVTANKHCHSEQSEESVHNKKDPSDKPQNDTDTCHSELVSQPHQINESCHSEQSEESTQIKKIKTYKNSVDKILLDLPKDIDSKESFSALETYKKLEKEGFEIILAGGINLDNIDFYLKELNPKIVDIARGIEVEPGKKDMSKMIKMVNITEAFTTEPRQ